MSNDRKFKVTLNEDELKAVISYNSGRLWENYSVECSARIHDLTKRLNRDTPEVEQDKPNTSTEDQSTTAGW